MGVSIGLGLGLRVVGLGFRVSQGFIRLSRVLSGVYGDSYRILSSILCKFTRRPMISKNLPIKQST